MALKHLVALLLVTAAGVLGLLRQRQAVVGLRQENEILRARTGEVARLQGAREQPPVSPEIEAEQKRLRAENAELPRLRNEVRQLRAQKQSLDKLRAENEQLRAAASTASVGATTGGGGEPQNFVSPAAFTNAGYATPQATLQTLLWAAKPAEQSHTDADLQRLFACFEPKTAQHLRQLAEAGLLREFLAIWAPFQEGFRLAGTRQISDGEYLLALQSPAGQTTPLLMKVSGGEWKLRGPP